MNFKNLPKDKLTAISTRGGQSKRSSELALAWTKAEEIKERYEKGEFATKLAEEYGVKLRSLYNIIYSIRDK